LSIVFTIARDGALDADFLARLVTALSQRGADVCCVQLTCCRADLEHRVASAERSRFGKVHSADRFRQLEAAGAFPLFAMPQGTVVVDTSGMSIVQAVAAVDAEVQRASWAA
jgi:hypothetical protein